MTNFRTPRGLKRFRKKQDKKKLFKKIFPFCFDLNRTLSFLLNMY